jgi:hypothetical protein
MKGTNVSNMTGDGGDRPTTLQGGSKLPTGQAAPLQATLAMGDHPPCLCPYFIVACYHGRWSIRAGEYKDPNEADVRNEVAD